MTRGKAFVCKHVRDLHQSARVVGANIEVSSYVGRSERSRYAIQISEWAALNQLHPNPRWWKGQLVLGMTPGLDDQPGGPDQADRIRDAQVSAIDAAVASTAEGASA